MLVKANKVAGDQHIDVDVNAWIPRVSSERAPWSRRKRTILFEDTPIYAAAQNGDFQMFEFLMKHKADVNRGNDVGMTPLHAACAGGHTLVIKCLCDKDRTSVNKQDHRGRTPAYFACQNGETDVLTFLIIFQADFEIPNIQLRRPSPSPAPTATSRSSRCS